MIHFSIAALFAAFGLLVTLLASSLQAAPPDNTMGVAMLSARVNASGGLTGGAGAVSAAKVGPQGQYRVDFARPIYPGCTLVATISGAGPTGERGYIVAAYASAGHALVRTYNTAGNFEDRPFGMLAFCEG